MTTKAHVGGRNWSYTATGQGMPNLPTKKGRKRQGMIPLQVSKGASIFLLLASKTVKQ